MTFTRVLKNKLLRTTAAGLCFMVLGASAISPVVAQDETDPAMLPQGPQPYQSMGPSLSPASISSEGAILQSAISAVRSKNFSQAEALRQQSSDPVVKKIIMWTALNNDSPIYGFAALDAARRELWGWPRESKRQVAAERLISSSGMTPGQIVEWFTGTHPQSYDGAVALISAYEATNRTSEASALAKEWYRGQIFETGQQMTFRQVYARYLNADDHKARINMLMLNPQNGSASAIQDLMPLTDGSTQAVAQAVLAMRAQTTTADSLYSAALTRAPNDKTLAFERARYLSRKDMTSLGFALLPQLPAASLSPDAAQQHYRLRLAYFREAMKVQNYTAAYYAMAGGDFAPGEQAAESEFFAGWIALTKLNNPETATAHFERLAAAGTSPITQGRANYWLGRAWEARGDIPRAQSYYQRGSEHIFSFYGQMAAEKAGIKTLTIGKDPSPSQADRERFESRDTIKAARLLAAAGEMEHYRVLVNHVATILPNAEELALLYDMARQYDSPMNAMRIVRLGNQRGFYLPERGFPVREIPAVRAPEKAFVLAITRQESSFDPSARSHANARGMMQLIPSTARAVARRMSLTHTDDRLYEPEHNMALGAYHLGELVDRFNGSYILAAAGYNAGPTRMGTWMSYCGDPRGPDGDALGFIECHPFTETRNYMMRVIENTRIYRARLAGGAAPLTAMEDVQRGVKGYIAPSGEMSDGEALGNPDGPVPYNSLTRE